MSSPIDSLPVPNVCRVNLAQAMALEEGIGMDMRLLSTEEGRSILFKQTVPYILKRGGGRMLFEKFGVTGLIAAAVTATAISGEGNLISYKDYSIDSGECTMAERFLLCANLADISSLNDAVGQSMLKFIKPLESRLQIRLDSLNKILVDEPNDEMVVARKELFLRAAEEFNEFKQALEETCRQRTALTLSVKKENKDQADAEIQSLQQNLERIETRHSAGIMPYGEYSTRKREIQMRVAALKINTAGVNLIKNMPAGRTSLDQGEELFDFYKEMCLRSSRESRPSSDIAPSIEAKLPSDNTGLWLALCAIGAVVYIFILSAGRHN